MVGKLLKGLLWFIAAVLLLVIAFILFLSISEYKPPETEVLSLDNTGCGTDMAAPGDTLTLLSFNTGYAGLGADSDFFMDGGKMVNPPAGAQAVNILGIQRILAEHPADILLLQEVDTGSARSEKVDQRYLYSGGYLNAYALNYSCAFVPFPWPPIGKVNSGLMTASTLQTDSAQRISLPCPFSWPVRMANLKRCLLVSYHPLEGTDAQLVVINLHLEAYDDGEGKLRQMQMLTELLESEYAKGNYVIAGGDFNCSFPGTTETWPIKEPELWSPGILALEDLPEGFTFAFDPDTPTCRLLNRPYDPADANTQYYSIDGFILSPNLELVSVAALEEDFRFSDHNPVSLTLLLQE